MDPVRIVRIVVASPSDVQAERNALPAVIEEINRNFARERGVRLELSRWEDDAYAGFHADGPQGLIDAILRIPECDIFLGLFWKRFGTPTKDGATGAEHEFRLAYEAWKQKGAPHVALYFSQKPYMPRTEEEALQQAEVLRFQKNIPAEGLWWPYKNKAQFEKLIRSHIAAFLRQRQAAPVGAHPARPEPGAPVAAPQLGNGELASGPYATALRESYLNWLIAQVRSAPLSGVDPDSIREESRRDLDLATVYTALWTQRPEEFEERRPNLDREAQRLSAVAVLNAQPRLALLGDPGGGKSTFVNFVALCMAGELLGRTDTNLAALRTPVPDDDREDSRQRKKKAQPWNHGPLLPVRVVLREFVARGPSTSSGEGLIYPWGNEWREDHANTDETGINGTSAVGCFPQGASPSGCVDMAENVWEWTRSLYEGYPYPADEKGRAAREDLQAPDSKSRVLLGGAFRLNQWFARCASRNGNVPDLRLGGSGFRVIVLPKPLDSEASGL